MSSTEYYSSDDCWEGDRARSPPAGHPSRRSVRWRLARVSFSRYCPGWREDGIEAIEAGVSGIEDEPHVELHQRPGQASSARARGLRVRRVTRTLRGNRGAQKNQENTFGDRIHGKAHIRNIYVDLSDFYIIKFRGHLRTVDDEGFHALRALPHSYVVQDVVPRATQSR